VTSALPYGPGSRVEAYAMLAQHALSALWANSDFQPRAAEDLWGCCPTCCAPCGALLFLDRSGVLDAVLAEWPEGVAGSSMFVGGKVDREWMYRQWAGSPAQESCGHQVEAP
jgi:hypothetical protein